MGDVAALHDQVLTVFNGGLHHLTDNGPEICSQGAVMAHGGEGSITAADQTHFQMVHGKVGIAVCFQKSLGQGSLAGMAGTGAGQGAAGI